MSTSLFKEFSVYFHLPSYSCMNMEESEDLRRIEEMIDRDNHEDQVSEDVEYAEFSGCEDSDIDEDPFEFEDFEVVNCSKPATPEFPISDPMQFINEKEKQIIDSCSDPELKELLTLNRTKHVQLMQLYRTVRELLAHCHTNISGLTQTHAFKTNKKLVNPRIWRMGMPYFKTVDNYPCPRNPDAIRKDNEKEILVYDLRVSYKWSEMEMNRLLKGVAFQYKVNRETELMKKIQMIESTFKKSKQEPSIEVAEDINHLKKKLNEISDNGDPIYPPRGCETYLDWHRIAERFLRGRYNDVECQVFWNIYLHPDINKTRWTDREVEQLKRLAQLYNYQEWDRIAKELGNNRTGFMCCVHYYCQVDPPKVGGRFTAKEDELLCNLVQKYSSGNHVCWARVATHHSSGRSKAQLLYRYRYFLSCKNNIQKGKFTAAEDVLILVLVDRFGKCFSRCACYFPNRSMIQIKARYSSNLQGSIKKGSFTLDEDEIIMDFASDSDGKHCSWTSLVPKLKRSGAQIRQRYNTLRQFLQKNPDADLKLAPRRKWNNNSLDCEFQHIRNVADEFKDCSQIPTLADIRKRLKGEQKAAATLRAYKKRSEGPIAARRDNLSTTQRNTGDSNKSPNDPGIESNCYIDELLTEFFSSSMKREFEDRVQTMGQAAMNERAVGEVLSILQAQLHIPKNYRDDSRLDRIDVDILDVMLKDKQPINDTYVIDKGKGGEDGLVPPNLNTLYGMKGLMLQNENYRNRTHGRAAHEIQVLWCINSHLSRQPEPIRNQLLIERELFLKRFVSIFTLPIIMYSVRPNPLLLNRLDLANCSSAPATRSVTVPASLKVKTYQKRLNRPADERGEKNQNMVERLKRKIQDAIEEASHNKPKSTKSNLHVAQGQLGFKDVNSDLEDLQLLEVFLDKQDEEDDDDIFEDGLSDCD